MKRLIIIVLASALLLPCGLRAQERSKLDPVVTEALDAQMDEYFAAIERESIQVKLQECDFMLESCEDSLVRQYVAVRIYDHYLGSKVMGDEAVAVHMVDDWFIPGKVAMYSDIDLLNARVYAQFHRSSLIGMEAPGLALLGLDGSAVTAPAAGAVSVLFFYDTTCSKCKLELLRLREYLPNLEVPLEFFAVYTGAFEEQWKDFLEVRWDFECPYVNIHHAWDPELDSNFQMLYGVLQTPQMLLIDADGTIVGRSLDTEALAKLLPTVIPQAYEYGSDTSVFETLFGGEGTSAANILEMAQYIKERALARKDSVLCRHMLGDMLYYLMDTPGEEYKIALGTFITMYIDSDPAMWSDPVDYRHVVVPAGVCKDLLGRTPVGSKVPRMKVNGVLVKDGGPVDLSDVRPYRLRRLRGRPSYILFHTPGCSTCDAEIEAVRGVFDAEPDAVVLLVNPAENGVDLLDRFDLSVLPFALETDRRGTVQRKYISFL